MKNYFDQICISLDIETTGFSQEKDKIIEIGLVKFKGDKIIDSFESLINPEIEVPYEILSITGIKQSELKKSPKFSEIKEKIKSFIGNYPIVGHNVQFDLNFLASHGLKINNPFYDTWELSLILLPNLPTYSLNYLANFLKIYPLEKHRALADAQTASQLFNQLIKLIYKINFSKRKEINLLLKKSSSCLKDIFDKVKIISSKKDSLQEGTISEKENLEPLSLEKINHLLRTKKIELSFWENQLIETILESFKKNRYLFIETLVKNPIFLITSFYYSLMYKKKVAIIGKDCSFLKKEIISLKEFFPWDWQFFNWPNFFLCLKKINYFKKQDLYTDSEIRFLIKIILWLSTGLEEINLSREEKKLIKRIIYNSQDCFSWECPFYQECYFYQGKKKAEASQVILIDQNNFLKNSLLPSSEKFLPKTQKVIFIEPEYLEDELTLIETERIDSESEINFWQDLENILNYYQSDFFKRDSLKYLKKEIEKIKNKLIIYWGIWGIFWQNIKNKENNYLLLEEDLLYGDSWEKVKKATSSLIFIFELIRGIIENLIEEINKFKLSKFNLLSWEFKNYLRRIQQKEKFLQEFVFNRGNNFVYWIKIEEDYKRIYLNKSPLSIKEKSEHLFDNYSSVIMISEGINQNNFHYWQKRLGLNNFKFMTTSFLKNKKLPKIYFIKKIPEPGNINYQEEIINYLDNFLRQKRGNTFILFNSFELMKKSFRKLLPLADKLNLNLLSQHQQNDYLLLQEIKKEKENFYLLGKSDLLQKLSQEKIPLENLIITKIHFDSNFHPIHFKKNIKENNGFLDYLLPRSLLGFKKNLANFLKISLPISNIYILDSRLINKNYAQEFMNLIENFEIVIQK